VSRGRSGRHLQQESTAQQDEVASVDGAEALASYAKQAEDDALLKTAARIRACAIRRCGELLRAIKAASNQHDSASRARGGAPTSRSQAARDAGLSRDQKRDAIRVARIPEPEFEPAVESEDPPTVTQLAERSKAEVGERCHGITTLAPAVGSVATTPGDGDLQG